MRTLQKKIAMSNPLPTFTPDQVWFTSDTHFGHENIIRFCNRPFRSAEEINAELIRRWREVVPQEGIVFVDKDASIGPAETARLREAATDIIELVPSVPVKEAIKILW